MKNEKQHIDELLVKSMLEEADVNEQMEINSWLADSDDNQRYFEHFELVWNHSIRLAAQSTVNENEAWERFKSRVSLSEKEVKVLSVHSGSSWQLLRIAAAFLICFCAAWLAYSYFGESRKTFAIVTKTGSQTLSDTLPDGTTVFLNRNSSITYPNAFKGNTREVTLTGEAFFEVTPNREKPFLIHINDVKVRVVGTSFNIKDQGNKTEVIVETGMVEVAANGKKVSLKPQEEAVAWKSNAALIKSRSKDEFHNYYRTRKLVCDNTPLWRLVNILNETYQANIIIQNQALKNRTINTTFDRQSIDQILLIISETLSLDVQRGGGEIILK